MFEYVYTYVFTYIYIYIEREREREREREIERERRKRKSDSNLGFLHCWAAPSTFDWAGRAVLAQRFLLCRVSIMTSKKQLLTMSSPIPTGLTWQVTLSVLTFCTRRS